MQSYTPMAYEVNSSLHELGIRKHKSLKNLTAV